MTRSFKVSVVAVAAVILVTGCATTKPRRASEADLTKQVESLQNELQAKDQQIQDLQYQLDAQQGGSVGGYSRKSGKSASIRVSGVSISDVQRALANAGYDPGPVDGRLGKRTKSAIKQFQRRNNLNADGVVGERTWSLLKS